MGLLNLFAKLTKLTIGLAILITLIYFLATSHFLTGHVASFFMYAFSLSAIALLLVKFKNNYNKMALVGSFVTLSFAMFVSMNLVGEMFVEDPLVVNSNNSEVTETQTNFSHSLTQPSSISTNEAPEVTKPENKKSNEIAGAELIDLNREPTPAQEPNNEIQSVSNGYADHLITRPSRTKGWPRKLSAISPNIGETSAGEKKKDLNPLDDGSFAFSAGEDVATNQIIGREGYIDTLENSFLSVNTNPLSTFSIDVDRASYANMRRFLTSGNLPPVEAIRIEELINYFDYQYEGPKGTDPFNIITNISQCPWARTHKIVRIGVQGKRIEKAEMPASNLVFLIDVSGSMSEANKLPLVQKSLKLLVEQLRAIDRVAIVTYAGESGEVLPSTSGKDKEKILKAIDGLSSGGSTAGASGISLAYKIAKRNFISEGNNRVILATDGDFNVGVSSNEELTRLIEDKRKDDIFLSVLGVGTGNYQDAKMELLADKGNGNFSYLDNINEAKKVLVTEMSGSLLTIAKDVKIQVEFNPANVKAYRLVGYENRMLKKEDFNDDRKDAGELGAGHSVTAIYELVPAGSAENTVSVDELKYQKVDKDESSNQHHIWKQEPADAFSNELMTIKLRYKNPDSDASKLISTTVLDTNMDIAQAPESMRFAVAVAEFGMLLKGSSLRGDVSYDDVINLAKKAKGLDDNGLRAEFIKLVESASLMSKE